ncbi:unnamed protein product [Moneuplotes crassus]|uniref:Uncharacterized protein n=1 Tax=Euplotes crassus TaxID=5936 RepID=A0AAD2D2G8_EUPCR|nr:unnamed protein product [Moneuplotes crassus]
MSFIGVGARSNLEIAKHQEEALQRLGFLYDEMNELFVLQSHASHLNDNGIIRSLNATEFLKIIKKVLPELIFAQSSDFDRTFIRHSSNSKFSVQDIIKNQHFNNSNGTDIDMECDTNNPNLNIPLFNTPKASQPQNPNPTRSRRNSNIPNAFTNLQNPPLPQNPIQITYFGLPPNTTPLTNPREHQIPHSPPAPSPNPRTRRNSTHHTIPPLTQSPLQAPHTTPRSKAPPNTPPKTPQKPLLSTQSLSAHKRNRKAFLKLEESCMDSS